MAGVYNSYAVGYREIVFVTPEVTYGSPVHPSATHAVQIIKVDLEHHQERVNRTDKTMSRSWKDRISHRIDTAWSIQAYNMPSGTSGTAPDTDDILTQGMGTKKTIANDVFLASSTATLAKVADGSLYAAGDAIGWVNSAGELEVSFVTSVATNDVTHSPGFSGSPATSDALKGSVTYKLNNVLGSLTITRVLDNFEDVYVGNIVNNLTFDFPGTAEGTVTFSGVGKISYSSGSSTLSGSILAGGATVTVQTGHGKRFQKNTRLQIDNECVLVTAVSGDVLSITRAQAGTSAAGHADAAPIGPWEGTSTVAGSPISGTIGDFILVGLAGTVRSIVKSQQSQIVINQNGNLRNSQYGTDSASGFFNNRREVTLSFTLWLEPAQAALYNNSKTFTKYALFNQLGKTLGSVTAFYCPSVEMNIPKVDGGGEEEVSLPITGMAFATTSTGNDEVTIAYL